jgi:hypothetical protein
MKNYESTYALLVRSEDKSRSRLEVLVYALFILSAVVSIWQFAHQSVAFPIGKLGKLTNAPVSIVETQRS